MKFVGYTQHILFYKTEAKAVATGSTVLLGRGFKMQSQNHQKRLLRCAGRPAAPSTRHLWGDTRGQSSRYHKHKNESNNTTAERYKLYFNIRCKFLCQRFLEIVPQILFSPCVAPRFCSCRAAKDRRRTWRQHLNLTSVLTFTFIFMVTIGHEVSVVSICFLKSPEL